MPRVANWGVTGEDTDAGGLFSPAVCTMAEGWPGLAEPGRLMRKNGMNFAV